MGHLGQIRVLGEIRVAEKTWMGKSVYTARWCQYYYGAPWPTVFPYPRFRPILRLAPSLVQVTLWGKTVDGIKPWVTVPYNNINTILRYTPCSPTHGFPLSTVFLPIRFFPTHGFPSSTVYPHPRISSIQPSTVFSQRGFPPKANFPHLTLYYNFDFQKWSYKVNFFQNKDSHVQYYYNFDAH